jgi:hypothetical protein
MLSSKLLTSASSSTFHFIGGSTSSSGEMNVESSVNGLVATTRSATPHAAPHDLNTYLFPLPIGCLPALLILRPNRLASQPEWCWLWCRHHHDRVSCL